MNTIITRMWVARELARHLVSEAVVVHITFGPGHWQNVSLPVRIYDIDLGQHEWWQHLDPDDVMFVIKKIASNPVLVNSYHTNDAA